MSLLISLCNGVRLLRLDLCISCSPVRGILWWMVFEDSLYSSGPKFGQNTIPCHHVERTVPNSFYLFTDPSTIALHPDRHLAPLSRSLSPEPPKVAGLLSRPTVPIVSYNPSLRVPQPTFFFFSILSLLHLRP